MAQAEKLTGMLGLAARARALVFGVTLTCDGVRNGTLCSVCLVRDASGNSRKRVENCCKYYETLCLDLPITAAELSAATGRSAPVGAIGIKDRNFAGAIEKITGTNDTKDSREVR